MGKKNDDEKLLEVFKHSEELEKMYKEMDKETLINIMLFKDMMNEAFETENGDVRLWCFVSDQGGDKYLSNEHPKSYFVDGRFGPGLLLSDGEVNIRIPKSMEPMFPDIKYGDEPVMVTLSISF